MHENKIFGTKFRKFYVFRAIDHDGRSNFTRILHIFLRDRAFR